MKDLMDFVWESNKIEGIYRVPTDEEIEAHVEFLKLKKPTIAGLARFVSTIQPGAVLRDRPGLNVRVGNHFPPPGGKDVPTALQDILDGVDSRSAYANHVLYETLHPFTDGNGRSGRVLWLWQMSGSAPLGFLHKFYYQALGESR